ncbi:uncharacterized protein LOC124197996 [Daphnia pulex]|uniref:uncharacterized protein LOC124197996 n=1 Tax=Daphnia pulex TaxID=6669 RepID=UPI001EDF507C|nr:uncharacterized protein LOC124197996 [Daphnia pulex]
MQISIVILASLAALVASAPAQTKTVINVDGPDGQHVQTGEPGKAVNGYFTSRSLDGMEHRTLYEADERGFRATGAHLPVAPGIFPVQRYSAFPSVYPVASAPSYGYRYAPENYYPYYYPNIANPNVLGGKLVSGKDYLPAVNDDAEYENLDELSTEEIAALTERGPLTPLMLPMMLMNKKNIMLMLLANKIMMALG